MCKRNPNARFWSIRRARIASALNRIIHNTQFKRKVSLEEQKAPKEDRFFRGRHIAYLGLRVFPGHWSQRFCRELYRLIYNRSSKWWYSGIRFAMGRNSTINDANSIWWHLGRIVQTKNTRVWETQDRIGIVQHGDSPEESWTWLSQIEDSGEKKYRAESTNKLFLGQKRKLWKEHRGQESGGKTAWTKDSRRLLAVESQRAVFWKETIVVFVRISISVQNWHSRILLRVLSCSRMREMHREPEVPEAEAQVGKMARLPCKDYFKRTCTNSILWKVAPSSKLVLQVREWLQDLVEKCSNAHRQVEEQPSKRSKQNGDKSASSHIEKSMSLHDRTVRDLFWTLTHQVQDNWVFVFQDNGAAEVE